MFFPKEKVSHKDVVKFISVFNEKVTLSYKKVCMVLHHNATDQQSTTSHSVI